VGRGLGKLVLFGQALPGALFPALAGFTAPVVLNFLPQGSLLRCKNLPDSGVRLLPKLTKGFLLRSGVSFSVSVR
jgi:hypothetical protein